jgi:hypothetical protein
VPPFVSVYIHSTSSSVTLSFIGSDHIEFTNGLDWWKLFHGSDRTLWRGFAWRTEQNRFPPCDFVSIQ